MELDRQMEYLVELEEAVSRDELGGGMAMLVPSGDLARVQDQRLRGAVFASREVRGHYESAAAMRICREW